MAEANSVKAIVLDTDDDTSQPIFRPNANMQTNTTETRAMTPETDGAYFSVPKQNTRTDPVTNAKEVESLRSIIDRLDEPESNVNNVDHFSSAPVDSRNVLQPQVMHGSSETYDMQGQTGLKESIMSDFNEVLSTMRVDMITIVKLLQTLHAKTDSLGGEGDQIKGDIYNLIQAIDKMKAKITDVNDIAIRRQQKATSKTDLQIEKICKRLEALERSNFTTSEPVMRENRHDKHSSTSSGSSSNVRNARDANIAQTHHAEHSHHSQHSQQAEQSHSMQVQAPIDIQDAQSSSRVQNIRVRSKRTGHRDQVGDQNISISSYGRVSRSANRSNKHEDRIESKSIKTSKMANRGILDSVGSKKTQKLRNDVIKNMSNGDRDNESSEEVVDDGINADTGITDDIESDEHEPIEKIITRFVPDAKNA